MRKIDDLTIKGKSKKEYKFAVFPRNVPFRPRGAVYLMSQRSQRSEGSGSFHVLIYIGQTDDLSNRPLNPGKKACFDQRGADHISIYFEPDETKRLAIEADIIGNTNFPCNK